MKAGKKSVFGLFITFALFISLGTFFLINGESKNALAAVSAKTYSVTLTDTQEYTVIASRFLPSENATEVVFELSFDSFTGDLRFFAGVRGAFYGSARHSATSCLGNLNPNGYLTGILKDKLQFTFSLTDADDMSFFVNGTDSTSAMSYKYKFPNYTGEDLYSERFGICFSAKADNPFGGSLTVRCYDDTGKDLAVTYSSDPDHVEIENVREGLTVYDNGVITEFSEKDGLFFGSLFGYYSGRPVTSVSSASLNSHYCAIESSDEIISLGANGQVLKITPNKSGQNNSHYINYMFSKPITAEQIDGGMDLCFRVFFKQNGGDFMKYVFLYPLSDTQCIVRGDSCVVFGERVYSRYQTGGFERGFSEIYVENEELKKLRDENGNVEGLTFYIPGSNGESSYFELFIDSVSLKIDEKTAEEYEYYRGAYLDGENGVIYVLNKYGTLGYCLRVLDGDSVKAGRCTINKRGEFIFAKEDGEIFRTDLSEYVVSVSETPALRLNVNGKDCYPIQRTFNVKIVVDEKVTTERTVGYENDYTLLNLETPSGEGKTFKGWYYGNGREYDPSERVFTSFTIYAKWEYDKDEEEKGACSSRIDEGICLFPIAAIVALAVILKKRRYE